MKFNICSFYDKKSEVYGSLFLVGQPLDFARQLDYPDDFQLVCFGWFDDKTAEFKLDKISDRFVTLSTLPDGVDSMTTFLSQFFSKD